jgi:hypothetical protein
MNTVDVLEYGHATIMTAVNELENNAWNTPGVCGIWSAKDILAHLTSFEYLLIDVLHTASGGIHTPTLDRWMRDQEAFNDFEVGLRQSMSAQEILLEYQDAHLDTISQIVRIPPAKLRQKSTLPWYGAEYDIEDFIVYTFYGHKREHAAQIAAFRERLKAESRWKISAIPA